MDINDVCAYGFKDYFVDRYPGEPIRPVDPDQVEACRAFIRDHCREDKRGHTSYQFKHIVEGFYNRYIQNGAFIVAAILEGKRLERIRLRGPNAQVFIEVTTKKRGGRP